MNEKEFLDILKGNKVIAKENRKETLDDIRQSLDALIESKFPNSQNLLHILYENLNANNMDIYRVIFSGLKEKDFTKFLLPDNKGNTPLLVFAKICQGRGGNDMYLKLRNFLFKQLECDVGEIKNIKGESPNGLMREKAIQNPTDEILTDITAELVYLAVNKGYESPRAAGLTGAAASPGVAALSRAEESPRAAALPRAEESPRAAGSPGVAGSPRAAGFTGLPKLKKREGSSGGMKR